MSIQGLGNSFYIPKTSSNNSIGQNLPASGSASVTETQDDISTATQQFLDYMKKTPLERMEEAWLAQHGLSKEKLAAMSPAERQGILDAMRQDIEQQMKESAENPGPTDILA
jgi:acyl-CoA reductase-like NAD-dependent aldehyde dehydrogenase